MEIFQITVLVSCLMLDYASAIDKVICYYESWESDHFKPADIDVSLCTHINYANIKLNEDGTLRLDEGQEILSQLGALKTINANIKLLLTVGGSTKYSPIFSSVAKDATKQANLIKSSFEYFETYHFDGLDLDWEYPGQFGGAPEDRVNFVELLKVLRKAFDAKKYILTVAVHANPDDSYNANEISKYVDVINVMSFDFHMPSTDQKTGQNSPLFKSSTDGETEASLNCDAAINNWLNSGADPTKLAIGLSFYGHEFELADEKKHDVGAAAGAKMPDRYIDYRESCTYGSEWTEEWDNEQQAPFKYTGKHWLGFDNPKSIAFKVQYAKKRNLGAVMIYAINNDDYTGTCGSKNALSWAVKNNV